MLQELLELWGDKESYFARARRGIEEAERLLREEDPVVYDERDAAWDNESLRADVAPEASARQTAPDS